MTDAAVADSPSLSPSPVAAPAGSVAADRAASIPDPVIEIRNLTKVYRDFWGRQKVRALNSVSFDVRRGEIFGLLGPNGSGKTTTMKILLGLLFPTDGSVNLLGAPPDDVEKKNRIGYLPEESYLYRFLSADETLDFYGNLFNIPKKELKERKDRLIEQVGLKDARRRQLKEYSKGMTRRIGLAQALINDPDLVLLDEPTSGLDPIGTRDMKDMIVALRDQGKTVVMCSHLLSDVQDVCDRIAMLYQGELKLNDRVDRLLTTQDQTLLRTDRLTPEAEAEIRGVLERHNLGVKELSAPTTSLEDLFLSVVRDSKARPGVRFDGAPPADPAPPVA